MGPTRRHLVAGAGAGLLTAGYTWRERRGFTRDDCLLDGGDSASAASLSPGLASLLRYASLAPSGHNTQPWVVEVREGVLSIRTERSRWLPEVDAANRELALSIGAFLENLLTAASSFGYCPEYEVTGSSPREEGALLQVRLRAAPVRAAPLAALRLRRTLRSGQLVTVLSQDDASALAAAARGPASEAHFVAASSREGRYLAEATVAANSAQANRVEAQRELAGWIRWSDGEAGRHRDGLTPESMEITGLAGWYVRHFFDQETVKTPRFRQQGVDRVSRQVANCAGWIVVTSLDSSLPSLIETGRLTERMWLGARPRSIAIHPMTQILEEPPFRDRVGSELGISRPIQFLLRTGYVREYPDPVSLRRPPASFLA